MDRIEIHIYATRWPRPVSEGWEKTMRAIGKRYHDRMQVILPPGTGFTLDRANGTVAVKQPCMMKIIGLEGEYRSSYFRLTYAILEPKLMKFDLKRRSDQYTLEWRKFCERFGYPLDHVFRTEVEGIHSAVELCDQVITVPNYGRCLGSLFDVVDIPERNVNKVDWENAPKSAQFLHKGYWYKIYKGELLYYQHDGSGWARSGAYPNQLVQTPNAADFLKKGLKHMEDRAATYDKEGGAERSMGKVVGAFNIITGHKLTEEEGWHFMELLKQVRSLQGQYKEDCYEDLAAYAALRGECAARERGEAK